MTNRYGDVELDAAAMQALAHPVRLRILHALQHEPSTATRLSEAVGASPSVTSWHLRHLAQHGLIVDEPGRGRGRERWWRGVGTGIRFAATDDASRIAAAALQAALDEVAGDVVGSWRRDVEPGLSPQWSALAASMDTTIRVTADELTDIADAFEAILAPYVRRSAPPAQGRKVRLIRHTLPEADPQDGEPRGSAAGTP